MTTPITKKEATKPGVSKRALIQLRVTGFKSNFPNVDSLQKAVQNRATALGYNEVGTVTIDSASTEELKLVNIAANDIEPVRLVGVLDDVLKSFMVTGYAIELGQVSGPVRTEMKLVRMTRREYKAANAAATTKSVVQTTTTTPAAKKTATPNIASKAFELTCKRTKSHKKFTRAYAVRDVAADQVQTRTYAASGSEGVSPETEATLIGFYLNAMWQFESEVTGASIKVKFNSEAPVEELDSKVGSIAVLRIPGQKTAANLAAVATWQQARAGVYVSTGTDPQAYVAVGPKDQMVEVPKLA